MTERKMADFVIGRFLAPAGFVFDEAYAAEFGRIMLTIASPTGRGRLVMAWSSSKDFLLGAENKADKSRLGARIEVCSVFDRLCSWVPGLKPFSGKSFGSVEELELAFAAGGLL